ncbi:MAG: glycoside hydrolase family 127 protein [Bryobacteraceae bacterium]
MLSRRSLLGCVALAAAPARSSRRLLSEVSYSQVTLTSGPLADMYRRLQTHFLGLDEDRLLKVYRQRTGMPAPGRDMGGWYDAEGFLPGHLIGQFISGYSRIHAHTGSQAAADKARRLVRGYGETIEKDGVPYASKKASTWACYILDKYNIGLIDAAQLAGIGEARTLLPQVIAGAASWIPGHTFDRIGVRNPPYDEPFILPENLFLAHELTGDRRYLDMARRYLLDQAFFDPLAEGRNVLPGQHGYSHVIALSSGAKAYETLGDAKYLRAIRNAWDMIEQTQQYASGAWAPREEFVKPHSGGLGASLTTTRDHFETPCCFYAHAKLARYLTMFTGDARYGDGLERVLFNTILGSIDPDDDGGYFYYSDYQARAQKRYYHRKWPCCAGTLLQSVADYPLDIYFLDSRGVYVNFYTASELRWNVGGVPVRIAQHTEYPESEEVELRVNPEREQRFTLRLRIPGWLAHSPRIAVNGRAVSVPAKPGTFAAIDRRWKAGDRVELTFPMSFRTVPVDDRNSDTVALMRGPIMLTAVDPPAELAATAEALARSAPVAGKPLEFDCAASTGAVRLRPFYRVQREMYSTYFRLMRNG